MGDGRLAGTGLLNEVAGAHSVRGEKRHDPRPQRVSEQLGGGVNRSCSARAAPFVQLPHYWRLVPRCTPSPAPCGCREGGSVRWRMCTSRDFDGVTLGTHTVTWRCHRLHLTVTISGM